MAAEVAQSTVIKEFASLEDAQLYSQSHPEANPFVFYITGSGKLYYSTFSDGGSIDIKRIINTLIDGNTIGSLDIPNSVTEIRPFAFYKCYGLTNITIPNTVTSIGNSAFRNTGLESVEIPNSVETYVNNASGYQFQGDTDLTYVKYFKSGIMTALPTYEFAGCTALTEVDIDTTGYTSIAAYAFQNCTSLITFPEFSTVTSTGTYAFSGCTGLTTIPDFPALTSIGTFTFSGCTNASNSPKFLSLASITESAFQNCAKLKPVFGTAKITNVAKNAFAGCAALETIDLSNINATGIHVRAFNGCTNLNNINFGSKITTLPSYAFNNCKSLTSITLPATVTTTGFYNANKVTDDDNGRRSVFANCTALTTVNIIGNGTLTNLPQYYFQNCTSLTNAGITIPDEMTAFMNYAFAGCTSLTKPVYRNDRTQHTSFSTYCFSGCTGITDLDIPAGQTSLGGTYMFNGCTGLTSITLPSNILTISERCFNGCTNLTYFKGTGLTSLAKGAFYGCTKLVTVDLPASCTALTAAASGVGTFYNCSSMTTLILRSPTVVTGINSYTFQGIKTGGKIYVPQGMLASYQAVDAWYSSNSNYYPKKMGWTLHELDANGNIPS